MSPNGGCWKFSWWFIEPLNILDQPPLTASKFTYFRCKGGRGREPYLFIFKRVDYNGRANRLQADPKRDCEIFKPKTWEMGFVFYGPNTTLNACWTGEFFYSFVAASNMKYISGISESNILTKLLSQLVNHSQSQNVNILLPVYDTGTMRQFTTAPFTRIWKNERFCHKMCIIFGFCNVWPFKKSHSYYLQLRYASICFS